MMTHRSNQTTSTPIHLSHHTGNMFFLLSLTHTHLLCFPRLPPSVPSLEIPPVLDLAKRFGLRHIHIHRLERRHVIVPPERAIARRRRPTRAGEEGFRRAGHSFSAVSQDQKRLNYGVVMGLGLYGYGKDVRLVRLGLGQGTTRVAVGALDCSLGREGGLVR